jgi:hypothetical protein
MVKPASRFPWQHNFNLAILCIVTTYGYLKFHERSTAMTISINSSTSGFRKWSEAQELKKREKTRAGVAESRGAAASVVDQGVITSDETLHRPWLVPGVGRL